MKLHSAKLRCDGLGRIRSITAVMIDDDGNIQPEARVPIAEISSLGIAVDGSLLALIEERDETIEARENTIVTLQAQLEEAREALAEARRLPVVPSAGVTKLTLMRRLLALEKWAEWKSLLGQLPELVHDAWQVTTAVHADDPILVEYGPAIRQALALSEDQWAALMAP